MHVSERKRQRERKREKKRVLRACKKKQKRTKRKRENRSNFADEVRAEGGLGTDQHSEKRPCHTNYLRTQQAHALKEAVAKPLRA